MHIQQVKAVCFDVGNVLVEVDIPHAVARLGLQVDDQLRQKIQAIGQWETYDAFERGHILEAQFLGELRAHLAVDLHHTELVAWWNSSLGKMVDGVEGVLSEVVGRMPVYALSNTNPTHFDHFTRHIPLLQRFDRVIASFHVGYRKPEAQLFEAVAQLIGQAPEHILFIDDLRANVDGAKAVGYHAEICARSSTKLREILAQYGVL
jgi:HAD superfamily hydrolase (TIGR01509 family)